MIKRLISSERSKWIFVIGVIAICAGFSAKNVISYPTECISEEVVQDFVTPQVTTRNFTIF
ncbi:hypothetical protein [Prochlorococcus marinus]|uniref:hypothetical protein n=1 Tax=Prochlorococcus marinus TaxID=1219 RepID=UPI0022B2E1B3|nr:hypothetical protein [Prochlorococcus marinus]